MLSTIIFISILEAIFNVTLGLLFINEKEKLQFKFNKIIRFTVCVVGLVTLSVSTKFLFPANFITVIINIVFGVSIFKYSFNISFKKTIYAIVFFTVVLITLELLYIPPIMFFIKGNFSTILNDSYLTLVCAMPEKFLQLCIVVTMWNLKYTFEEFKEYKSFKRLFGTIITLLYVSELIYLFTFVHGIDKMDNVTKIVQFVGFLILISVNVSIFKLISMACKIIIHRENKKIDAKKEELHIITEKLTQLF